MRITLVLVLLLATAAQARSQDGSGAVQTVDGMARCRTIQEGTRRLACYDELAVRITAARASGDLLVLDRRQVIERKQRAFGLASPATNVFGGGSADQATQVSEVESTIQLVRNTPNPGRWNMQLANGMVWQSVDSLPAQPRVGSALKLKPTMLGGFRGSINGGRSFLVRRVR